MEPPVGPGVEELRDAQGEGVRARCDTLEPDDLVRGQFEGYRDEPGVAPDSDVETFAAVRLHIDSWRWAGVPVLHPRRQGAAGARAPRCASSSTARRKRCSPSTSELPHDTNYLRFQFDPQLVIAIGARAKAPGDGFMGEDVELYLCNDAPGRDAAVRAAARRRDGRASRCCSRARTASRRRGGSSTTCSPTTARPSRYKVHTWGPEEQNQSVRRHRRVARPDPGRSAVPPQ